MLFNSIEFLVFLPLCFVLYWFVVRRHFKLQNVFILLASYVFYGWWDYRFLALIAFSTLVDFFVGKGIRAVWRKGYRLFALLGGSWVEYFPNVALVR